MFLWTTVKNKDLPRLLNNPPPHLTRSRYALYALLMIVGGDWSALNTVFSPGQSGRVYKLYKPGTLIPRWSSSGINCVKVNQLNKVKLKTFGTCKRMFFDVVSGRVILISAPSLGVILSTIMTLSVCPSVRMSVHLSRPFKSLLFLFLDGIEPFLQSVLHVALYKFFNFLI